MPSIGITSSYYTYTNYTSAKTKTTSATTGSFGASVTENKIKTRSESVVRQFVNKHPDRKHHVDQQLHAGRSFLMKSGADTVSRQDMTMEEYKQFFTSLMDSIPFDSSQKNDIEVWSITEKGWEQMKNDPDYEAWVLGYTVLDRAVHFPFASMPGFSPSFHTEHFGASIEEHIGQSVPMNSAKEQDSKDSDEESWWVKRHKKIKQLLAENAELAREKAAANQAILQEQWLKSQGIVLSSSHSFAALTGHADMPGIHQNTRL